MCVMAVLQILVAAPHTETDMGRCVTLEHGNVFDFKMKPAYHKCKLPNPNTDPEIVQYCGWEGGMMNVLHSPLATVYADRAPQLAPALWIGDCFKMGLHPKDGRTQS